MGKICDEGSNLYIYIFSDYIINWYDDYKIEENCATPQLLDQNLMIEVFYMAKYDYDFKLKMIK